MIGLSDPVAQVRAQAVQLAAKRLRSTPALLEKLAPLAADLDARVRFQVALALGESSNLHVGDLLLAIAQKDGMNLWIRAAVLSSCTSTAQELMVKLWPGDSSPIPASDIDLLGPLAETIGARNNATDIGRVLDHLALASRHPSRLAIRQQVILSLARGLWRTGGRLRVDQALNSPGSRLISQMISQASTKALDNLATESARVDAINILRTLAPTQSSDLLLDLLKPSQPVGVQVAAVKALGETSSIDIPGTLLPRVRAFEPVVRMAVVQTLLARPRWTKALLEATARNNVATGITPVLIELADRAPLLKHRDADIASLARSVFTQIVPTSRARIVNEYMNALAHEGDLARGAKVFERECMACHQIGGRGIVLGPDLTGSPSANSNTLLANILEPNANVLPKFVQYLIIDQDGRSCTGIIAAETATSITLRRGGGAEDTILRARIAEMTNTGLSLMPEGLERVISKSEMADLIAFLRASHRGGDGDTPISGKTQSLDIGTLPGLVEPDN